MEAGHQPVHSYRPDSESARDSCVGAVTPTNRDWRYLQWLDVARSRRDLCRCVGSQLCRSAPESGIGLPPLTPISIG